jgi:hypothetical protein
MTTQTLTPTTKELIFERINQLEKDIDITNRCIQNATIDTDHLVEFWILERELMKQQQQNLKNILFQ